ncbi:MULTISPECIES: LytTR family DNA-binding domain-containing protein [Tatumella]|uniref:LytR/AlgR family response regulator transcription factor n=1 Tax=Tatumella punctata TaxID=399969 RepID=A0ABW1VPW9_9GAMM|nr:response regulator transcription factor [Tatumella sp. JGM16]MBS0876333.1 response regulator transcription factor [Tatumella sp. JGM82]MBS0889506.1 response regulator transcription factor [Tatumella sp. JGM94]MBS0894314.1 response regulator transcription factor [Tatumella sp. JGM130]MBS0900628.1 response regulator transcription factor [Tatumella sp. JGM100]MBS0913373.1 response regulator transcription factor [Tatumella sp. JGM91]
MKAIIVEDEFLAQQELRWMIQQHSNITIDACFSDGLEVLKYLQQHQTDVIFLDINIPSLDGMLLAKNISLFAVKPLIVFITAWKDHAVEAFELEAFDYILKPYQESRIISMLRRLTSWQQLPRPSASTPNHHGLQQTINLIKDDRIIVTDVNDICYAEAHEKLTIVCTRREQFIMSMSISEFYQKLPENQFFRCHRSFCVNLSQISEIEPWFNNTYIIKLRELEFQVPVSRSKVKEFRQLMNL